ncbi:7TM diverse intracellular signaling domain-containing protein [Caenimonas koreensis]|uniref:7TM diverse intracellular signaling domain-containing protein n=1 Tax=Caenimonas koreensis TaxID=367474 RepID=UPI00188FAA1D|nr:7TM diverse intracellular signaling domain-containing protein [Caenimonas koreensis]
MAFRSIIVFLIGVVSALGMVPEALAQSSMPVVALSEATRELNLAAALSLHALPASAAINPDQLWGATAVKPPGPQAQEAIEVEPDMSVIGRATLSAGRSKSIFFVQVPTSRVDHVQLWTRPSGGAWSSAEAGDTVPLAKWPFYGQFPAFGIAVDDRDIDVIIVLRNNGTIRVPVLLKTEKDFQEGRLRQANLTGFVTGMGLMTCVVCLLSAASLRVRPGWLLLLFSVWVMLTVVCANGYAPIWLLPDWPELTDKSKAFCVIVLAGLTVWTVGELLDRLEATQLLQLAGPVTAALALTYATVQATLLPGNWRGVGVIAASGVAAALALGMCIASYRNGARYAVWMTASVITIVCAAVLGWLRLPLYAGLDWSAATSALMLFAAALLMRHTQFLRARYGRDVMSRAAIRADRDPLTAMLSYAGLEQSYSQALLSEAAGQGHPAVMLFLLPGLDRTGAEYGHVLTERALVRFAATLQERLGQEWMIGRLSKTRFGAISVRPREKEELVELATLILSRSSRQSELPAALTDFDLRIVFRLRGLEGNTFADVWRQLDEVASGLAGGRRIAMA